MAEGIGKLNLGTVKNDDDDGGTELGGGDMIQSPRAQSDLVVPTTPRGGQKYYKQIFKLTPEEVGRGPVKFAWQRDGGLLAVVGSNHTLGVWDMAGGGESVKTIKLEEGAISWLGWDCDDENVAVMQPKVALCVWSWQSSKQLMVIDQRGKVQQFSFLQWARTAKAMGLGGDTGRVLFFDSQSGKIVPCKDGGHMASITCGDWTADNRLVLASKTRIKVSEPVTQDPDWKTATKMKFQKIVDKVPQKSVSSGGKYNPLPTIVKTSTGTARPQLAINLGCKVIVVIDTESMKDEGFFIPMDYGEINNFVWLANGLLAVALSNGFILAVDTDLLMMEKSAKAARQKAGAQVMTSGRIFNSYLSVVTVSPDRTKILACGDSSTKIVECNRKSGEGLEIAVTHDHPVERELEIGCFLDNCHWSKKHFCVSSNDGYLYCYSSPSELTDGYVKPGEV